MSKSITFQIKFPLTGYRHALYFNHFRIVQNGTLCVLQVLLDQPLSHLTFAIEMVSLLKVGDDLIRVVDRAGIGPVGAFTSVSPWKGFADGLAPYTAPELVDFIFVSLGEFNELLFGRAAAGQLSRLKDEEMRKSDVIEPEPVAMLRSDRATMGRLLFELGNFHRLR